jgi:hypothetical protein
MSGRRNDIYGKLIKVVKCEYICPAAWGYCPPTENFDRESPREHKIAAYPRFFSSVSLFLSLCPVQFP